MATPITPIGVAPPAAPAPAGGGAVPQGPVVRDVARPSAAPPPSPPPNESLVEFTEDPKARQAQADNSRSPLERAAEEVKAYLASQPSQVQYEKEEDLGQIVIKLLNPATKEVIRQIPSEEIVALAKKLRQLSHSQDARGALLDEQG